MPRCCDIPEPERVSLILENSDDNFPKSISALLESIKTVLQQELFLWKDFPVLLPESILSITHSLNTVFSFFPEFDQFGPIQKHSDGIAKPLDRYQLKSLRRTAQFSVPSSTVLGESHIWKMNPLFIKGVDNIHASLKTDLYEAFAVFVIHAVDRINGDMFSLRNGFAAFVHDFLKMAIDLFFGWPHVNHGNIDQKLFEERLRFITCELSVKSSQRKNVTEFWDAYEEYTCLPRDPPSHLGELKQPPYRFVTPGRIPIDLRLHDSVLLERCLTLIDRLRHPARIGWFQEFKKHAIQRYEDEGKPLAEIKHLVSQEGLRQYASRLFDALRRDETLASISTSLAEPLIQQATFSLLLAEAKDSFWRAWLGYREHADQELRRSHGFLYHIAEWRARQLDRIQREYFQDHKFDIHNAVLSKCVQSNLEQHAFFVGRDLTFLRDREQLLREQLEKSSTFPDTQFIFRVESHLPRHWKVYRKVNSYGSNYELIDTVLLKRRPASSRPVSAIAPCVVRAANRNDQSYEMFDRPPKIGAPPKTELDVGPQDFEVHSAVRTAYRQPDLSYLDTVYTGADRSMHVEDAAAKQSNHFVVQSSLVYKTSTRYFLWRWLAFLVCTYTWLLRAAQLFLITIPFRSAFSFTVLFQCEPICLNYELDPIRGCLFPNESSYQDTLCSRIRRIWSNVRQSRRRLDSKLPGKVLDKTAMRLWLWLYVLRGLLSSFALALLWPPLCLLVSTLSIAFGLLLPVIVPCFSLCVHLLGLLFWDAYKPASKVNRFLPLFDLLIGHLLIRSVLQILLVCSVVLVACPFWFVLRLLWAFVRFAFRSFWDGLVFHLFIRHLIRVPNRENFMIKRISGPGVGPNQFYQARPVHILVLLVSQLELLELQLWRRQMENLANRPIENYNKLVRAFSWLSLTPTANGEVFAKLLKQTHDWHELIKQQADLRYQSLQIQPLQHQLKRLKLCDRELHQALKMGGELTEYFFLNRIAPRLRLLKEDPHSWWSAFSLSQDNYLGLCINLLERMFGEEIFTCIVETDRVFPLQISDPSITRQLQEYLLDMIAQNTSARSLDTVALLGSNEPSAPNSPRIVAGNPISDEAVSLSSDAFPSDFLSQRCTVVPALKSSKSDVGEYTSMVQSGDKTVSPHDIGNPASLVHVELPLFPLSAFVPITCRQLPKPLSSFPIKPSINMSPCFACPQLDRPCACCICPNKADLDRVNCIQSIQRWNTDNVEHVDSLYTLLLKHEHDLRQKLPGWSWTPSLPSENERCSHLDDRTLLAQCKWFFAQLFRRTSCRSMNRSPITEAVQHLGRVYHPTIITLLMHSRDREHHPLDFGHPAIQYAVSRVTVPEKQYTLFNKLLPSLTMHPNRISHTYPTLLASGFGSTSWIPSSSFGLSKNGLSSSHNACDDEAGQLLLREHNQNDPDSPTAKQFSQARNTDNLPTTQMNLDPLILLSWNDALDGTSPSTWSNSREPCVDTPSVSLYGTEDAATADELDETEDALSVASVNHHGLMAHLFPKQIAGIQPLALLELGATSLETADVELSRGTPGFNDDNSTNAVCTPTALLIISDLDASSGSASATPRLSERCSSSPNGSLPGPPSLPRSEPMENGQDKNAENVDLEKQDTALFV